MADGNNFDSSYILFVTFLSQGGTAKHKELGHSTYVSVPKFILKYFKDPIGNHIQTSLCIDCITSMCELTCLKLTMSGLHVLVCVDIY